MDNSAPSFLDEELDRTIARVRLRVAEATAAVASAQPGAKRAAKKQLGMTNTALSRLECLRHAGSTLR